MRGYKTELDPTPTQVPGLLQHAGAARWAYNWGLERQEAAHEAGEGFLTAIDLHHELCQLKKRPKEAGGVSWMYGVSKCAPQEALRNLEAAFRHFFRRCRQKAKRKGYPRRKTRKRGVGSFTLTGTIRVQERSIQLPRLGSIRLKEAGYLPVGLYGTATVSERAGRWFVSVRTPAVPERPVGTEVLGCDVGITALATLSDGTVFAHPQALRAEKARLRMLQQRVARRQKGGKNRKKAVQAVARQHYRIACIRQHALHQATSAIAKRAAVVGIESLHVAGMLQNRRLARALSDASLAEFHRQLRYKLAWSGGKLVEAGRFSPSSKLCSVCGQLLDALPLDVRRWTCPGCGTEHDRDVNAAVNLRNLAVSSTVTAYCPGSAGRSENSGETPGWVGTDCVVI
jgi:putative transposase